MRILIRLTSINYQYKQTSEDKRVTHSIREE